MKESPTVLDESVFTKLYNVIFKNPKQEEKPLTIKEMAAVDPNETRTVQEIVVAKGYGFEAHTITTDDGYILELHRIINKDYAKQERPVMFLQHGILASSESWIMNGPDSLGFRLANEGYDVWMGNNRGNMYSKKHLTLDLNDPSDQQKYFDFSFYELAEHDLPAQIDYVRETSGQDKVTYIGHS
jgi:lysosomal acid lipase/cholesteryl ester hydrolase